MIYTVCILAACLFAWFNLARRFAAGERLDVEDVTAETIAAAVCGMVGGLVFALWEVVS